MNTIDLEKMPAMVSTTFRIPLDFEDDKQYKGTYRSAALPVTLPDGGDGYAIYVTKLSEDNSSRTIIWSETIKMKEGGFVLVNHKPDDECFVNERSGVLTGYYHSCASPFALFLNVAVFRAAPEKIDIKLTGPFSETY